MKSKRKIPKLKAFIGGIHGVGKSHFANKLSSKLNAPVVSAGELIYKQRMIEKNVVDIDWNQDILIRAFNQLSEPNVIMDGHYTLLNSSSEIERINPNIFQQLNPDRLTLIKTAPQIIMARLADRDAKQYPIKLLSAMQEAEEEYYIELCSLLNREIDIVRGD